MVVYGPPGIGKTSFGAATIRPIFMIDDQEDGVNTLKASGLVDAGIPVLPAVSNWTDVLGQLEALATAEHNYGTLVIDTLGGLERLCHTHVCATDFKGIWGDKGFSSYAKGYEVALPEWRRLLMALDRLRTERGMMVVGLSHAIVKPFKNPIGEDFDRYIVDLHHKTWNVTSKWADLVLFANYFVAIDKGDSGKSRAKGVGGQERILYTEHHAAYDAKNRHGLSEEITMGESGADAWSNLVNEIKARKAGA